MQRVYTTEYTLSTRRAVLTVMDASLYTCGCGTNPQQSHTKWATANYMILPPRKSASGAPGGAEARPPSRGAVDCVSLLLVAAGAIPWASDVLATR